jgi:N,N'-diacetyllegionaminate synthase
MKYKKKRSIIIAEAGVNHNGDMNIAFDLIDIASSCKADYVKFQTFKAENLSTPNAKKAKYQINKNNHGETQFEMLKKLEIKEKDHAELIKHADHKNIKFLSSPFDISSVNLLNNLGVDFFKVPSGEITNLPYLQHVGSLNKPVVISSGMATIDEISDAIDILTKSGMKKDEITVLHCNTSYPTDYKDVNLNAMLSIQRELNIDIGFSDHTKGIEISVAAVALGAKVIEKHFTYDCNANGPDHAASLEPDELKEMIKSIRNIEDAMGNGEKVPSKIEKQNKDIVRKSIFVSKDIKRGEVFSEKNLTIIRPGTGVSPMLWYDYIGRIAKRDYKKNEPLG